MSDLDAAYAELQDGLAGFLVDGGRLAVVKAPPGSGKTHLLIECLVVLIDAGMRVVVAAQTNSQADDICKRFAARAPSLPTARFASAAHPVPPDMPPTVAWVNKAAELTASRGVTVSTTAKLALTTFGEPFDLLAVDESWQMSWADLMQCALLSARYLFIGDPGQIPPVVTIDVRRWETSSRAPHDAAPEIVLRDATLSADAFVGALPACRRLPNEAVPFLRPFYDFDFEAYVAPERRGIDLPTRHALADLADGLPLALTLPTPDTGPPLEVDLDVASVVAGTAMDLLASGATVRDGGQDGRPLRPTDVGLSSSHRVMNAAISDCLGTRVPGVRVDTPERWQGLERPVMIVVHPLAGAVAPTGFDLETGRLCVMASRHRAGLVLVTRDHIETTMADFVPAAEQAPGRPDTVGRGHDAHVRFWEQLRSSGRVRELR